MHIVIILLALLIVLPIMWMIISRLDKRMRKKNNLFIENNRRERRKRKRNILTNSYSFFTRFSLTRTYVKRLRIIYEMTYPSDNNYIIQKSMLLAYYIWLIGIVEISAIFIFYPTVIGFINASVIVIYTTQEFKNYVVESNGMRLLTQFDRFLSGVRHRYYSERFVDTAIIESGEEAGYEMSLHAKVIESILNAYDREDAINSEEASSRAIEEYNESTSNSFMKMFLSLAKNVMEFGDNIKNGQSVFLQNISDMRNEVNLEMRNIKENNYMFQALTFVATIPILSLYPIKRWAISNLPELDYFFNGRTGILISIFLYILTITCYIMVCHFKLNRYAEIKEHKILERMSKIWPISGIVQKRIKKNYSKFLKKQEFIERIGESITVKQLYIKQMLFSLFALVISIILFTGLHINEKNYIMNNVKEGVSTNITAKENDVLSEIVLQYANQYRNEIVDQVKIEELLQEAETIGNDLTRSEVAKMIFKKINQFQNEYFKWYEMLIAFLLSVISFQIPYLLILYRVKILEMTMETEVIQFQNVIIMLMYIKNISVKSILEQMEIFAVTFKKSIQKCLNNFSNGDIEALEILKEDEKFGPFRNLVDNFICADKIGIEAAFEEIATDRENSRERRKQEGKFNRDKRAMYATVIAFTPVVAILVLYLIGPFLLYCFEMYKNYKTQMNSMF